MAARIGYITVGFLLAAVLFITTSVLIAWTGPSSAPPNSNVSAPINVGTADQVKNAGLSVNALAVFGNAIISGASRYLNFGTTVGETGYGFRDNAGVVEFKNNAGNWSGILPTTGVTGISFADGTTQTTAATSTLTCVTIQTAWAGPNVTNEARCPAGYVVTGGGVDSGGNGYAPINSHPSPDGKGWIGLTGTPGTNSMTYARCCKL